MFDLQILKKINKVEQETGESLPVLLKQVPFMTVMTAFKEISVSNLIEMVQSVPMSKLIHGLSIISIDEIEQIPVEKLKIVLKYGNMNTVSKLQEHFGSRTIIIVLHKLTESELTALLKEDNYEAIAQIVDKLGFIK